MFDCVWPSVQIKVVLPDLQRPPLIELIFFYSLIFIICDIHLGLWIHDKYWDSFFVLFSSFCKCLYWGGLSIIYVILCAVNRWSMNLIVSFSLTDCESVFYVPPVLRCQIFQGGVCLLVSSVPLACRKSSPLRKCLIRKWADPRECHW